MVPVRAKVTVQRVKVFICRSQPSTARVKISHVIVECRVIYHQLPKLIRLHNLHATIVSKKD